MRKCVFIEEGCGYGRKDWTVERIVWRNEGA